MQKLIIAFIISIIVYFLANLHFSQLHSLLLANIALLVTLWTNEGLPLGVVSLLPIILFPALGIMDTNAVTSNYSKSIIFLFLGGFMIAIATQKVGLHKVFANRLLSLFPPTPRGIIFALATTSALLSMLISNTTTALLLLPIALYITDKDELKARFVLSIAYGASLGGIATPIGTPPNLIFMGFVDSHNLASISFIKWMAMTMPIVVIMLVIVPLILSFGVDKEKIENPKLENDTLTKDQKSLSFIMLSLVFVLLFNSPVEPYYSGLGLNEKGILLFFGLILFLPKYGFLNWKDTKEIPYEIILLFGAGFSIASAFSKTGLAGEIASMLSMFADYPFVIMLFVIALFVTFTTEITSNTALISIILPIIYSLNETLGDNTIDINIIMMVATICASYAFMLPIATPPNAIAMSSGVLKIRYMAKIGFFLNIIGVSVVVSVALLFW
jgi:sodium-dependent dicarboxylate transporter 2/3/5